MVIIDEYAICGVDSATINKFSTVMEQWLTNHWAGGINIPTDFPNLSLIDKLKAIDAAQEEEPCADLHVSLHEGRIVRLKWVSGSGRGAIYAATNGYPRVVCIDGGTTEDFRPLIEACENGGIKVATIKIDSPNNPYIDVDDLEFIALLANMK